MAENETPLTEQGYSPKELLAQVDKALTAVMVGGQSYKIGSRPTWLPRWPRKKTPGCWATQVWHFLRAVKEETETWDGLTT